MTAFLKMMKALGTKQDGGVVYTNCVAETQTCSARNIWWVLVLQSNINALFSCKMFPLNLRHHVNPFQEYEIKGFKYGLLKMARRAFVVWRGKSCYSYCYSLRSSTNHPMLCGFLLYILHFICQADKITFNQTNWKLIPAGSASAVACSNSIIFHHIFQ